MVFSTTMGSKFLTIVTLLFIAFAQVTTNVLNNIVPPAYVLMESFKMKWTHATVRFQGRMWWQPRTASPMFL